MVAWQDTREAARALREALPFVEQATRTVLVLVDPDTEDAEPEADVVRHLARHTARVEAVRVAAGERTTAEALLDEARRVSADLVVMGGYGHSRIAEWVMGGVTVDMLFASPYPLLMAH
jgi:nucleotide-binding universal stress UspA family protein